tara:strand:- start:484 stop:816 length:333 start_codon:yes stop_codon:yes gene_type:complete
MDINRMKSILVSEELSPSIELGQDKLIAAERKQRDFYNDMGLPHINDFAEKGKYVKPMSQRLKLTKSTADKEDEKLIHWEIKANLYIMHWISRFIIACVIIRIPFWMGIY